jgi:hypothetical protein
VVAGHSWSYDRPAPARVEGSTRLAEVEDLDCPLAEEGLTMASCCCWPRRSPSSEEVELSAPVLARVPH